MSIIAVIIIRSNCTHRRDAAYYYACRTLLCVMHKSVYIERQQQNISPPGLRRAGGLYRCTTTVHKTLVRTCSVAAAGRRAGAAEAVQFLGELVQFAGEQAVQARRRLVRPRLCAGARRRAAHVAVRPRRGRQLAATGRARRGRALDEREKEMAIQLVRHVGRVDVDVHEAPESVVVDCLQQPT